MTMLSEQRDTRKPPRQNKSRLRSAALNILLVGNALWLSGCIELGQHWDDKKQQLEVDFFREPCSKTGQDLCYRERDSEKKAFALSQASWVGLDAYTWGNRYRVNVQTSFNSQGKPTRYDVQDITQITDKSSETFALTLYGRSGILQPAGAGQWLLGSEILLNCGDTCTDLNSAVNAGDVVRLELAFSAGQLQVSRLLCRSPESTFASDCQGESEQNWQVAPFMSDCGFTGAQLCLLYRTDTTAAYERLPLSDGVQSFTYRWGERRSITVRQRQSSAGLLQSATLISDDANPQVRRGSSNSFRMILRGDALTASQDGRVSLYGGAGVVAGNMPALDCSENSLCSVLNGYISNDQYLLVRAYLHDTDDRLILDQINCHSATLSAFRACVSGYADVNWIIPGQAL